MTQSPPSLKPALPKKGKMTCVEEVVVKVFRQFCSHDAGGQAEPVRCVCVGQGGGVRVEAGGECCCAAWNKEMGWIVVVWRVQLGVPNALVRHLKGL